MPLQHDYKPIMVILHPVKYIGIVARWIRTYKCYIVLGYMYGSSEEWPSQCACHITMEAS